MIMIPKPSASYCAVVTDKCPDSATDEAVVMWIWETDAEGCVAHEKVLPTGK